MSSGSSGVSLLPPILGIAEATSLPRVVFCDVRWYLDGRSGQDAYDSGHLPGAVFIDLDRHLTSDPGPKVGRHPFPTSESFARSMGALGIGPDDPVVAYDDAGGMAAGRLVWMLRILDRPAALLDGGGRLRRRFARRARGGRLRRRGRGRGRRGRVRRRGGGRRPSPPARRPGQPVRRGCSRGAPLR